MNLLIEAEFSEPPSSTYCFRDLTLYAKCFLQHEILIECEDHMIDTYWNWLKNHYALDFVDEILCYNQEKGVSIRKNGGSINLVKLDEFNLPDVLYRLKRISS